MGNHVGMAHAPSPPHLHPLSASQLLTHKSTLTRGQCPCHKSLCSFLKTKKTLLQYSNDFDYLNWQGNSTEHIAVIHFKYVSNNLPNTVVKSVETHYFQNGSCFLQ